MARPSLSPALLVLAALAASAPHAQEVDCAAACRMPILAPDECACDTRAPAGTGGEVVDPRAAAILDDVEQDYQASIASVADYTVVQSTNLAPMPVVLYYQKEVIGGRPTFRYVPPSEIADREAEARGDFTAEDISRGVGALADLIGGGSDEGNSSGGPPSGSGDDGCGEMDLSCAIAHRLNEFADVLRTDPATEIRQSLFEEIGHRAAFRSRARFVRKDSLDVVRGRPDSPLAPPGDPPDQVYPVNVLRADSLQDVDLGEGYEEFELQSMEVWTLDGDPAYPLLFHAELRHVPSGQPVVISQKPGDFQPAGPMMVPRFTREHIDGLGAVFQTMGLGDVTDIYESFTTVHEFIVNAGMPSQEEARQLIQEVLALQEGP